MIEYIVDKKKRKVVAIVKLSENEILSKKYYGNWSSCDLDAFACLRGEFCGNSESAINNERYKKIHKLLNTNFFVGKAKCNPNDEWDEELGKKIARERAYRKIGRVRIQIYDYIIQEMNIITAQIKERVNNLNF